MHLILITPGFAAHENDSSAVPYLQDLFRLLAARIGHQNISIITLDYPFTLEPYSWHGIKVYPCGGKNRKGLGRLRTIRKALRIGSGLCKTHPDAAVHSFWLGAPALVGARLSKRYSLKHIVTLMGQDAKAGNRYFRWMPKETTYVAVSDFQAKVFRSAYGADCTIIPHPLPEVKEFPPVERDIDLLFVGSFIPVKQPLEFIRIVEKVHRVHPQVKALMIGGGPLKKEMQNEIEQLQLQNCITLLEHIPREDVFSYMKRSKILLHTSNFEGQGLVMGEAILHGMVAVSKEVGHHYSQERHYRYKTEHEAVQCTANIIRRETSARPEVISELYRDDSADRYLQLY